MTTIEVRVAGDGDRRAIDELLTTARRQVAVQRGGREASLGELAGAEVWFVAAHHNDEAEALVGFLAIGRAGETAVVESIFVLPSCREVGVGAALLDAAIRWATDNGCARIDAVALPGDRATKNFFETHGLTARAIIVQREL